MAQQHLTLQLSRSQNYARDIESKTITVNLPEDAEEKLLRAAFTGVEKLLFELARGWMDGQAELIAQILKPLDEDDVEHPLTTARSMDEQRAERAVEQAADSSPTMDEIADSVKASTPGRPS